MRAALAAGRAGVTGAAPMGAALMGPGGAVMVDLRGTGLLGGVGVPGEATTEGVKATTEGYKVGFYSAPNQLDIKLRGNACLRRIFALLDKEIDFATVGGKGAGFREQSLVRPTSGVS